MKGSIRLGSLFGIPVNLHWTFLLLLGAMGLFELFQGGLLVAVLTVTLVVAVFGCVLLHELGHALAARNFGIGTRDVTLLPIGGLARLDRMPRDPRQELWIALAGPAVNVALAGLFGIWASLSGGWFSSRLMMINLALVAFNMLPAFPMDGGRVLRAALARRMGHAPATEIAATLGKGMAVLLGVSGLFVNPMLIFIALFVWFGAEQEAALARRQAWSAARPAVDAYGRPRYVWMIDDRS